MRSNSVKFLGLMLSFMLCSMVVMGQNPVKATIPAKVSPVAVKPAATAAGVSAEDQAAIKSLFAGVDQAKYTLKFADKTVAGKRVVNMKDLTAVKKVTNPAEAAGYIVLIVEGKDVVYVLAVGSKDIVNVLGQEKAMKLNQIMAKYKR